ncbi:MAG: hypothetical protein WKG07_29045 [Hymenobacter sp.]
MNARLLETIATADNDLHFAVDAHYPRRPGPRPGQPGDRATSPPAPTAS